MSEVAAYTTLDGQVVRWNELEPVERDYLARCAAAYRDGIDWEQFEQRFLAGPENPFQWKGIISPNDWNRPALQVARDMHARLGISQGRVAAEESDDLSDPFARRT